MPFNYLDLDVRAAIIDNIDSNENKSRKNISVKQKEVYSDNLLPYVREYLRGFYTTQAFNELPIIASVNLSSRIVNQEASLYKECPDRQFIGVSDEQAQALAKIYDDMMFDSKMLKSNRYFRLQGQNDIYIVPSSGKLEMRVLLNHHFDVVPNPDNPNEAEAYILSTYDKSLFLPRFEQDSQDNVNQIIGDYDDYKSTLKRYVFWSNNFNFITDKNGSIISGENVENPLGGLMPFVDISPDKDFEFWFKNGQSVADFTVQFNAALTDIGQVVRMQGFAQGVLTGDADLMPNNIQVGPMFLMRLPSNPNSTISPDFKFVSPNADIEGSLKYLETLLSNYLSSRGISPKLVTGNADSDKFSSGIERLLAMVDLFEASKSDIALYRWSEKRLFKIIAAYINTYGGTDVLPEYNLGIIPDDADVEVSFHRPEMIQTESDKLDIIQKKFDLGLITPIEAIMDDRGLKDLAEAEKVYADIQKYQLPAIPLPGDINGAGGGQAQA